MRDLDIYTDICRIEHDKAQVLTSTAELFEILADNNQETAKTAGKIGALIADILTLGSGLGLEYDIMYAKINEELKIRAAASR